MLKRIFLFTALLTSILSGGAQQAPFDIYLESLTVPDLGGLQAYAFGQSGGKWLVVGGRLDGLHRRQPFASFDVAGNNNQVVIVDPANQQKWSAALSTLPVGIQEQLSSTNMQFHQQGNYLYIVGGYGYNSATGTRKTFNNLTAVDVPGAINAIISGTSIAPYFRQLTDTMFGVTGGHLKTINGTYYLIGGNRFDGNYNPMGNPTYTQVYTNAIRRFTLQDDGTVITVNHLPIISDAVNLHRRDYNAVPQIMPNQQEGITAFSGVFQIGVDLPFLNCVNIDSSGYAVNNNFQQYYNHYHCAVLPLYAASAKEMHTVFFGGIAQYFDSAGVLVQDNNVPFVKTIARVTRDAAGVMTEYKMPVEMPGLLGASAEFIPVEGIAEYGNGVLKLDELTADTMLVGYIYGGISSTAPNIFFTNTGTQSSASSAILKVYVVRSPSVGIHQLNEQSNGSLALQVVPNPSNGDFAVRYHLSKQSDTHIYLYTTDGRKVEEVVYLRQESGDYLYRPKVKELDKAAGYLVTIETSYERATQKIMLDR